MSNQADPKRKNRLIGGFLFLAVGFSLFALAWHELFYDKIDRDAFTLVVLMMPISGLIIWCGIFLLKLQYRTSKIQTPQTSCETVATPPPNTASEEVVQEAPNHEYNKLDYCIHCSLARSFLQTSGRPCLTKSQRAERHEAIERDKKSPAPQVSNTSPKPIPLSTRYAAAGHKVGIVFGLACVYFYVTSPSNPNKGHLLGLQQDAVIFGIVAGCMIICTGIGYALGKWLAD